MNIFASARRTVIVSVRSAGVSQPGSLGKTRKSPVAVPVVRAQRLPSMPPNSRHAASTASPLSAPPVTPLAVVVHHLAEQLTDMAIRRMSALAGYRASVALLDTLTDAARADGTDPVRRQAAVLQNMNRATPVSGQAVPSLSTVAHSVAEHLTRIVSGCTSAHPDRTLFAALFDPVMEVVRVSRAVLDEYVENFEHFERALAETVAEMAPNDPTRLSSMCTLYAVRRELAKTRERLEEIEFSLSDRLTVLARR